MTDGRQPSLAVVRLLPFQVAAANVQSKQIVLQRKSRIRALDGGHDEPFLDDTEEVNDFKCVVFPELVPGVGVKAKDAVVIHGSHKQSAAGEQARRKAAARGYAFRGIRSAARVTQCPLSPAGLRIERNDRAGV